MEYLVRHLGDFRLGPLGVFFFVWLVSNNDRIFKGGHQTLSLGCS